MADNSIDMKMDGLADMIVDGPDDMIVDGPDDNIAHDSANILADDPDDNFLDMPDESCPIDSLPGTEQCSNCLNIHYCSWQCQSNDYLLHNLVCTSFREFATTHRPSAEYTRAIYFPEPGPVPSFVWLRMKNETDPLDRGHIKGNNFGVSIPETQLFDSFDDNKTLRRRLGKTIQLHTFSGPSNGGWNQSLASIDEAFARSERGPILAVGVEEANQCLVRVDLDTMDFRHVVDFLRCKLLYLSGEKEDETMRWRKVSWGSTASGT